MKGRSKSRKSLQMISKSQTIVHVLDKYINKYIRFDVYLTELTEISIPKTQFCVYC